MAKKASDPYFLSHYTFIKRKAYFLPIFFNVIMNFLIPLKELLVLYHIFNNPKVDSRNAYQNCRLAFERATFFTAVINHSTLLAGSHTFLFKHAQSEEKLCHGWMEIGERPQSIWTVQWNKKLKVRFQNRSYVIHSHQTK